ncbi:MAG: glycosyltransferase family 2 protein [Candidatus Margulisiibacteriota bacterium]
MNYSIVVPVYNSQATLDELHRRLTQVMSAAAQGSFEIIYVDDSSRDGSWPALAEICRVDGRARALQLMRNSGQHAALMCGLQQAAGDFVITLDDDLQHPPEEIPKLIAALAAEPALDAVMAVPADKKQAVWRNLGSGLANRVVTFVLNKPRTMGFSSFIIMTGALRSAVVAFAGRDTTIAALICLISDRVGNVVVRHEPRRVGRSNYSLLKLIGLTLTFIFNFTTIPLRLMVYLGMATAGLAFCLLLLTVYQKLTGAITVPGFATTTIMISFFAGVILCSIGLIGEYLMRMIGYLNAPQRYQVRQMTKRT